MRYYLILRCLKCHHEAGAQPISTTAWPTFQLHRDLRCSHQNIEARLTEGVSEEETAADVLVGRKEKGS